MLMSSKLFSLCAILWQIASWQMHFVLEPVGHAAIQTRAVDMGSCQHQQVTFVKKSI